ncbi:class I SAM-dependent methyltransferase [Croceibacter atlanticus]|jgi:O-methyltransferase involved in polyketide biosynthesis|uniref:class I SAM-dependent methyltransferase n=1 Tax=Croceibacter atlanticus TaxID=313588 RepID=UPI0024BAFBA3|nr:class I SAM-dependent methyltransferase [Croceibacter atlanticus]|tara:strand:- start:375 stop:1220 length:846 start_codon:yes stop_codon:yes gene_type:complete
MDKQTHIQIHETAFFTSSFRAFNEALSGDKYAKLWLNPKTDAWIQEYLTEVSSEETYTHCLRNRFFLETIKDLAASKQIEVLINFGSGFSMYPFLLNESLIHIEIDKPEIVNFKASKIEEWQNEKKLPKRDLHFVGVDFSEDYKTKLLEQIQQIKGGKPCFILIEGVLFFLDKAETDGLFSFFNLIQTDGDYVGSASFQDDLKSSTAFKKLLRFLNKKVSKTSESDYLTLQDSYYKSLPDYNLKDHQDYFSLSKTYNNTIHLKPDLILNEHFYVLKKQLQS